MGNDIVDRRAVDAAGKSRDARFVRRVLTDQEDRACRQSVDPDQYLWVAWAARETAYKAMAKSWPDISASPRRYQPVFDDSIGGQNLRGVVQTPKTPVYILVMIRADYIHCIGQTRQSPEHLVWGVERLFAQPDPAGNHDPDRQSAVVRRAAATRVAACIKLPAADVGIRRRQDQVSRQILPPGVYIRGVYSEIDISLSHHGRFAAYAFSIS
ncbi:MAG: 4'-phosphopantetheinyl transferase superfamily protein [Desulfobacterales bacterium]|nr:4'-phosphopantetheinyl transferase superfamily protein [Desulfobacterales bacterium]MBS3754842.1 4'-phosphopantetheinyl transferase superfamily protein [Desulfobacterales bacterium]